LEKLIKVYSTICIGDPFDSNNLFGPLISKSSVQRYGEALEDIKKQVISLNINPQFFIGRKYIIRR